MPLGIPKVEIVFDTTKNSTNFFTLNDPVKGVLNNSTYKLGGAQFVDVSQFVRSVTVSRGKNRELDKITAGQASVTFDNNNRWFDPEYVDSPYYGNIVPKREIRISLNDEYVFRGVIEDWNLNYSTNNDSTAEVFAIDGFALLGQQTLTGGTATSQLSGARVEAVLNDASVAWPITLRSIDPGTTTLQADVIAPGTNALVYLQQIELTEYGQVFIGRDGSLNFQDRDFQPSASDILLTDNGSGINYAAINIVYGSEQLYNEIELSRLNGGTAIATDVNSQTIYGIRNLTETDLLFNSDADMVNLAAWYAQKYAQPEYRFESIGVNLHTQNLTDQNRLLQIELGATMRVKFTPNGIGSPIEKVAQVIGIAHGWDSNQQRITYAFQDLGISPFILDDDVFGKLDAGNALSW